MRRFALFGLVFLTINEIIYLLLGLALIFAAPWNQFLNSGGPPVAQLYSAQIIILYPGIALVTFVIAFLLYRHELFGWSVTISWARLAILLGVWTTVAFFEYPLTGHGLELSGLSPLRDFLIIPWIF
jgi:hypothetical protein